MKYAREKGLSELKHHLLPRTKGFTLLLQGAEDRSKNKKNETKTLLHRNLVGGVYNLTVGFKKSGAAPTMLSIIKGRSCQAELFVK